MCQRTHFITVIEDKAENTAIVRIYYHPWGIGKIMPLTFMQLYTNCNGYTEYRSSMPFIDNANIDAARLGYKLETFYYYKRRKQVTGEKEMPDLDDWRDASKVKEIMKDYDNNNGCMFAFVTREKSDYSDVINMEIAFMLGFENEYTTEFPDDDIETKDFGKAYSNWLTLDQWFSIGCNSRWSDFKPIFQGLLDYWEVNPLQPAIGG